MAADLFPRTSFDHVGFIASGKPDNAIFVAGARLWVTNLRLSEANIEWIWPEADCTMEPVLITRPHVAYRVENLDRTVQGQKIIDGPARASGTVLCESPL